MTACTMGRFNGVFYQLDGIVRCSSNKFIFESTSQGCRSSRSVGSARVVLSACRVDGVTRVLSRSTRV